MPELPEVEVTRRGLLEPLIGRTVTKVSWSRHRLRLPMPRRNLQQQIVHHTIVAIDRRAKYLLFRLEHGAILVMHLGMTGKLSTIPSQTSTHRHDHLRLHLDNGSELRFNDSRRFGSVQVWTPSLAAKAEKTLDEHEGVEPFSPDFTQETLEALARTRRISIKAFLMNSRIIAGIGNIYANEILFATALNPETPAHTIQGTQWQHIVTATRTILSRAIEAGGTTIADFLGSTGNPGYFQLQLNVYGHEGESCPRCGDVIHRSVLGGRATFWCPSCQLPSHDRSSCRQKETKIKA